MIGKYLHNLSIYKVYIQTTNCLSYILQFHWDSMEMLVKVHMYLFIWQFIEQKVNTYW